tara:strand:- start:2176 stop:3798 length:1623 start_codon:yes stop_codon:yes gene_type:complete
MEPRPPASIIHLDKLGFHRRYYGDQFSDWDLSLGRREKSDELVWVFTRPDGGDVQSIIVDSIKQRIRLIESGIPTYASIVSWQMVSENEDGLISEVIEGEPLPVFLARLGKIGKPATLLLMLDIVVHLKRLSLIPRVLSCLELEDFLVVRKDGVSLEAVPALCFSLIRPESPQSDYQLALKWIRILARLYIVAKRGWKDDLDVLNPSQAKPFRRPLKDLESGGERMLCERFTDLEVVLRKELDGTRGAGSGRFSLDSATMPKGFLSEIFFERASDPMALSSGLSISGRQVSPFSPYVCEAQSNESGDLRTVYLLPPEGWFEKSAIDPVNRKMSHSFLNAHPNGIRIRSVFFEERHTILLGCAAKGLPLPSLLAIRQGLDMVDVLLLGAKLDRALQQFESAEFDMGLQSPWQVEIHFESNFDKVDWGSLLSTDVSDWPTWDIKLRVELPTEYYLTGRRYCSWKPIAESASEDFFTVLLAWMLDWARFDWAARNGRQADEPLSWDDDLMKLFQGFGDESGQKASGKRTHLLAQLGQALGGHI